MKRSILVLLLFSLTICLGSPLAAQDTTRLTPHQQEMNNYVVLTKKIPQLKPILLTAEHFRAEDGDTFGDFRVIICGQDITGITDHEQMAPFLTDAKRLGVTIVACGFSLKKLGVDPVDVPEQIEIVDNGIQYDFTLQKAGYYSLGL
ncbi:hypothetical protein [Lewinella sp. JB7]|uniref:hypothetical protein n=1 Tax=Lewinella sp. JB7 TaxID=2962887 RepID=UPI0020C9A277|nr:hypothetical protein [Lewinella sp. JB7]MCP9236538.1 hypothetical protein [Lewinella sp. JB7]